MPETAKKKAARLEFREGLYFENAIDRALEMVPREIKFKKSKSKKYIEIEFFSGKENLLPELPCWFANTVIALSKQGPA